MATYAIGDIHGRSDLLSELLGEIDPSPADHVVFLGDYIDRGADSRGVIEQLVGFQASSASRVSFLLGNHEQWLLQTLGDFTRHSWLLGMQGLDTVRSYSSEAASRLEAAMKQAGASLLLQKSALPYEAFFNLVPKPHQAFFKNLLPFVRTPDVICVHAGVSRDFTCVEREPISALVWSERDWWQGYTGSDPIVYGHWSNAVGANSSASPHVVGLTFGIDCVASGQLLAIRFPDLKHWVVGNAA